MPTHSTLHHSTHADHTLREKKGIRKKEKRKAKTCRDNRDTAAIT